MLRCKNCGNELPENMGFCPACGQPVAQNDPAAMKKEQENYNAQNLGGGYQPNSAPNRGYNGAPYGAPNQGYNGAPYGAPNQGYNGAPYGAPNQGYNGMPYNAAPNYNYQAADTEGNDSFLGCCKRYWKNYVNFRDRARRKEYWFAVLMVAGIEFILYAILLVATLQELMILSSITLILFSVFALAAIVPSLSLCVRRLHDLGKSGAYYLFIFIPLVGSILLLVWFCTDSQPGANQYGPNPKGVAAPNANFGGPNLYY